MDKEQEELQFIGFFGIWRESFKIIHEWSQIFLRLGLTLTLPLSFIYLAHSEINYILQKRTTSMRPSRELIEFSLIQVAYLVFLSVFSLLSTSAVVYTVACIFSSKNVTFKEVMRVVPKVWKRLMITFLCVLAILVVYHLVSIFIFVTITLAYPLDYPNNLMTFILLETTFLILYSIGACYMGVIWQLANTISVLEESYGFEALRKSKMLMKGKMGISISIFLVNNLCLFWIVGLYNSFVVNDQSNVGIVKRIGFGIISMLLLCILILVGLVVHTIFYLVCKSYHHERIDKSALAEYLEIYHGEGYVLLMPKDIQLMKQAMV